MIEHLPFPDASFDVALSTWMMHHLPDDLKRRGLAEMARVLKPAGRLVVVDATHPHSLSTPIATGATPTARTWAPANSASRLSHNL